MGHELGDDLIADDRFHLDTVAGNSLYGAVGLVPSLGRVEDHQLAHPRHAVMAGDDAHDLGRMARDGLGIEGRIRPQRVALVVLDLVRAVRVHVEQQPGEVVGAVRIFPAREEHPAIVQQRRIPIVVLVETDLPRVAAVGFHEEQVRHGVAAAHAGHALETAGRVEQDPAVGQVAGVVVIHVRLLAGRHLPQAAAVDLDLPNLPSARDLGHGKQQLVGVEVQVEVADELVALRLVKSGQLAVGTDGREDHDLVVVAGLGQGRNFPASSAAGRVWPGRVSRAAGD